MDKKWSVQNLHIPVKKIASETAKRSRKRDFSYRLQLVLLLFLTPLLLSAQGKQANNWYFNRQAGLTFNYGPPPQLLDSGKVSRNPVTTMSDENGNLLFYGDDNTIFNKEHNIMMNGNDVGNPLVRCVFQVITVPVPDHPNRYHYFTFNLGKLVYSTIDMTMDNGKGAVLPFVKGIPLGYSHHSITAVYHKNQRDIWVVVHRNGGNTWYSYKVTADGIESPVESDAGPDLPVTDICYNHIHLKLSPDGTKISVAYLSEDASAAYCDILDFDSETGIVSEQNVTHIPFFDPNFSSDLFVEFSSNSSVLYAKQIALYQFNLKAGTPQQIIASKKKVSDCYYDLAIPQLAPDRKIYIPNARDSASVIHNPNIIGMGCTYEQSSVYLGNYTETLQFPEFLTSFLREYEFSTEQYCEGEPTEFKIFNTNGIDSVFWKFRDFDNAPNDTSTELNPSYIYSGAGTYYPKLTIYSGLMPPEILIDTITILASPHPQLGNDTSFCAGETIDMMLDAGEGQTYSWNNVPGGTRTYHVTAEGVYSVIVTNDQGCSGYDTIHIGLYTTPEIANPPTPTPSNCGQSDGALTGLQVIAPDPFTIAWLDGGGNQAGTGNDLLNVPAGSYFAEVTYGSGCISQFGPYVIADNNALGIASAVPKDDDHCLQGMGSITITPETGNVTDYQYSFNGIDYFPLTPEITGLIGGPYNITLKDQYGCISAPVSVEVANMEGPVINCIPTPENGNNSDGSITVISTGTNLIYQLEGGVPQTGNVFTGLSANTYYVIVTDEFGCSTRDTVIVESVEGSLLVALADKDRKCLYKPANSEIKITRVNGLKDLKSVLYYNDNILNCTNFNPNSTDFPGIKATMYLIPPRIEIVWNGVNPLFNADTLTMGTLIFETKQSGLADINWEPNSTVTYFLNQNGDTIQPVLIPGMIEVHEIPEAAITGSPVLCEGDDDSIEAVITGGTDPIEFQWLTPGGVFTTNIVPVLNASALDAGSYTFYTSDYFNCADTARFTLQVVPLPTANFPGINDTIWYEQTYQLEATPGYSGYEWSTGDTTYYITVTDEGRYSVIMQTEEGCRSADTVMMMNAFVPIYIPNAFTPNSDGLNDTFKPIINTELVHRFHLAVYNKWGQRLFETSNAGKGWDGKDCLPGVYVWVISYENRIGKGVEMRGTVSIIK